VAQISSGMTRHGAPDSGIGTRSETDRSRGLATLRAVARKDKPYQIYRTPRRSRGDSSTRVGSIGDRNGDGHLPIGVEAPPRPWDDLPGIEPRPEPVEWPERRPPPRRRTAKRVAFWLGLSVLLVVALFAGWGAFGYFKLKGGIDDANDRLPDEARKVLTPQDGSLLSSPSNILLIGVDGGGARAAGGRADALVLVRTDPDHHRIAFLSIPRDLRVEIPGRGFDKINAAYADGEAALTVSTVENLLDLPVNHVAVVDFSTFPTLIDELGGITVNVPKPIVSNRFDCPFDSRAECERWKGWRFEKGEQTMNGRRALVYSRIRENQLDPSESDLTRGGRQQQVVQAIADEVVSFGGYMRLPFIGDDVVRPLATDLSATQLLELGWVKFRAADDATLRCRLGGEPTELDGIFYLVASEANVSVVAMVTGDSAPQPPPPNQGLFAPGCTVG
jgi:LCP family protein required for cell wall assembly